MTALPQLTDASRLRLGRFFVKGRRDHYTVIHRQSWQAITTSKAGVEAIRLLARGRTVGHTKRVLARRYGQAATAIDLAPLLDTLFSTGFVRTLDGEPIATRGEPARHGLGLWLTLFVWGPLLELALKRLPLRLALPLAYRWFARAPSPERVRRIADNLRSVPYLELGSGDIASTAARSAQALHKQFCDRLLLGSLRPGRLRRWLGREIRVSGLEHLASAIGRGRGTILCSFHLGSYGLLPFVLAARGVAVTVYAGFGEDPRANVAEWLADRARRGDDYPVRIIGGGMGLRTLARCLERGETVLLYCDQAPREVGGSPEVRGLMSVPFLGTRIWSARGVAWLRAKTGAAVLPAVLLWEGRHGHHLRIDPEIAIDPDVARHRGRDGRSEMDAVMVAVYGALERWVREDPAQWLKCEEFGDMVARG